MAVDLYLRIPTDPNYSESEIELDVEIENFLQCVEMVLTTRKGDVLGDPNFGANLEDYVWSNYSSSQIKTELTHQVATYCEEFVYKIPYSIEVGFVKGEIVDTIIVDIIIDGTKVIGIAVS
jgi:hypothetical protein